MTDTAEKTRTEKAIEPAKRWRNWARVGLGGFHAICPVCGAQSVYAPGELMPAHCRTYPSKDVAETQAAEIMSRWRTYRASYLGAYPEGQKP